MWGLPGRGFTWLSVTQRSRLLVSLVVALRSCRLRSQNDGLAWSWFYAVVVLLTYNLILILLQFKLQFVSFFIFILFIFIRFYYYILSKRSIQFHLYLTLFRNPRFAVKINTRCYDVIYISVFPLQQLTRKRVLLSETQSHRKICLVPHIEDWIAYSGFNPINPLIETDPWIENNVSILDIMTRLQPSRT